MRARIEASLTLTRRSAPPSPEGRGTRLYMTAKLKFTPRKHLTESYFVFGCHSASMAPVGSTIMLN